MQRRRDRLTWEEGGLEASREGKGVCKSSYSPARPCGGRARIRCKL